jgi:hypothetical protein
MKRNTTFIIGLIIMPIACCCQTGKWTFSLDYGLQAHDKRLFDFPPKESVLERHPETFGTHQFGIRIEKKVAQQGKLHFHVGSGLSTELSTFERPFNHNFGKNGGTEILRWTDRYYQFLMQFPLNGTYQLNDHFGLSLGVLPQLNFLTIANHTTQDKTYSWWRFGPYSVEFNPGIEYTKSRMVFSLRYRAFQVKKIDRILFNSIVRDPRTDQTFETYNPFKLWLSVGYLF